MRSRFKLLGPNLAAAARDSTFTTLQYFVVSNDTRVTARYEYQLEVVIPPRASVDTGGGGGSRIFSLQPSEVQNQRSNANALERQQDHLKDVFCKE